jgi:hypothetical protein
VLLLLSSAAAWWGEKGVLRRNRPQALAGFGVAFLMGVGFAAVQVIEWRSKTYGLGTSSYASLYFVTTGFHMAHVAVGLAVLLALFGWTALDYFSPRRRLVVSAGVLYWHFVDIGGPLAWYVQLCCGYALASQPCFSGGRRLTEPMPALQWTWPAMVLLMLAAVLTALLALLASWRAYRRTLIDGSSSMHDLMDAGAGRARFVALWGMLLGGGFALATAVTAVAFITLPRCAG